MHHLKFKAGLLKSNLKLKLIISGIMCLSSCAALLLSGILPGIFSKSFLAVSIGILVPVPCISDEDCAAGETCEGEVPGACTTTVTTACFFDEDCPPGETCEGAAFGTCSVSEPTSLLIHAESDLEGFVPRKFILTFDSILDSAEVTPDSSRLYVNDILHNTVSVIDTSINEVIAITPVGKSPEFTSITPDGKKAYVSNTDDGTLSVIDVTTNRVKQEPIALPDAFRPTIIAFTPDGSRAYVATLTKTTNPPNTVSSVSVINVKEDKFLKTIPFKDSTVVFDINGDIIGDIITSISPTPDSSKVFVSISPQREAVSGSPMFENGEVFVISVKSNEVMETPVTVGPSPNDILITEDGSKAYVLNFGGVLIEGITGDRTDVPGSVFIIDVEKSVTEPEDAVIATVKDEGLHPVVISGDPERSRIYVGYSGSDDIIDKLIAIETEGKGDSVIGRLDLANFITGRGVFPQDNKYGLTIMPDGSKLYLSENIVSENNGNEGLIQSIELNNNIFGTIRHINVDLEITGIEVAFEIPETEKMSNVYAIHADRISVIDTSTDSPPFKVIRPRGTGPTDLTLSPDGRVLFAVNSGRDTVTILNVLDDVILGKVDVGKQPIRVVVSPDSKAYVLNFEDSSVSILDGLEVNKIPINCNRFFSSIEKSDPKKSGPIDIRVSPDSSEIYVICFSPGGEGQGAIINFSNQVVGTLKLADASVRIDVPKDSGRAYVVNGDISEIRLFNTVNNIGELLGSIQIPSSATDIAVANDLTAYVTTVTPVSDSNIANFVSVVSVVDDNLEFITTIDVGEDPVAIELTPDGTKAYVANFGDNTVSVIDTEANTVIQTIPVGERPVAMAITPDSSKVYVPNYFSNNVSVIDTSTDQIIATVPVGSAPLDVTITRDGKKAYVANSVSGTLTVINVSDSTVIRTINLNP